MGGYSLPSDPFPLQGSEPVSFSSGSPGELWPTAATVEVEGRRTGEVKTFLLLCFLGTFPKAATSAACSPFQLPQHSCVAVPSPLCSVTLAVGHLSSCLHPFLGTVPTLWHTSLCTVQLLCFWSCPADRPRGEVAMVVSPAVSGEPD